MALNWTMLNPNGSPVPLPRETIITSIESGAEFSLNIPDAPPSDSSATSGGSGGVKNMKAVGGVWLTDQRLIFAAPPGGKPAFESLSIPLPSILSTKFEQPYFGANYLALEIKPSAAGGLTDGTRAEMRLKDQGLFGFISLLEKTRERAVYMKRQTLLEDEEGLPVYSSPAGPSFVSHTPSVPEDNPPGYDA